MSNTDPLALASILEIEKYKIADQGNRAYSTSPDGQTRFSAFA